MNSSRGCDGRAAQVVDQAARQSRPLAGGLAGALVAPHGIAVLVDEYPGNRAGRGPLDGLDARCKDLLHVHAFCFVLGYLLVKLLQRRGQHAGVPARSVRALLATLTQIREVTLLDLPAGGGRPKLCHHPEELDPPTARLADALGLRAAERR